ncbi:MAG: hypothetical protein DMF46_00425 [Verrucomicrobia bacterium]|nr:MAG: hypothetical protein DMF46_00425 [Verrucomicrobiota bacterium]
MISPYGPFVSYQVNVDANGNNIVGDAANEPSISVDPTNGNKMAIGWRQFNTWTSNFRQAGWGYTTDAGFHWTFPGVLQNNVFRSDPVTNSDDTGNFFYLSLLVQTFCGDIWRSTNGGQSWVERSPDGGAHSGDKEWFTVDRTPASMGHGFQYQSPAWVTAFNTSFGPRSTLATSADSVAPPMAESPGRLRSVFPTLLSGEHSTWPATAIFSSAAGIRVAAFGAFGRATHKTRLSRQHLIR